MMLCVHIIIAGRTEKICSLLRKPKNPVYGCMPYVTKSETGRISTSAADTRSTRKIKTWLAKSSHMKIENSTLWRT